MITYKDYEKKVYDWLMAKYNADSNFTFSSRQKGAKGSELDYFIGTEKSNYFGTTFWTIPVSFPGSSGDLIDVFFEQKESGFVFFFEFNQTNNPIGHQNISALNLIKNLKESIRQIGNLKSETKEGSKMYKYKLVSPKVSYENIEEMFADLDKTLTLIKPLVILEIEKEKILNPEFIANQISKKEFAELQQKFDKRQDKYGYLNNNLSEIQNDKFKIALSKFNQSDLNTYFDFLRLILRKYNLKPNDKRLFFCVTQNNLNFTIGQRYCWNLFVSNQKGKFGVISNKELNQTSGEFSGFGSSAKAYFTHFSQFAPSEDQLTSIFDAIETELKRTNKSSFSDKKNIEFENYSFENINAPSINKIDMPLNQILYGPPGTGKTYNTVLEAAKIVTGNETISYDEALKIFNDNLGNEIEFITFHQNYSYEDFIQGIRPDTENGSVLTFEKKDGVFKRIADRALKNLLASENPANVKKDFDLVFHELIQPLNEGDVEEVEIKMKKSSFFITEVGEKSIDFRKSIGDSKHTLSINTLRKMYNTGSNDIILGGLQPYYNPILKLLLEKGKSQVIAVPRKNFVIIIDEINRANISRVFGELITLIEDDKRSHGAIPMRVTLPSGDSFIVPSNLYIIGTMNTADKSIALLDIALRRRFDFVPMYPLYEGLEKPIYDAELLQKINDAILSRKNHDFTIGHAYFMGMDYTLENTINKKVIPLLLEYFMNDEKEVTTILQVAGIKIGGWPLKMIL